MEKKNKARLIPPVVTLTTDFGLSDGYVGVVKGVILSIARNAQIIDVTHDIPAHDLGAAAWNIQNAYKFFPNDAIHMVVCDPGVGSDQRGILLYGEGGIFVAPDNGVLSKILDDDYDWHARVLNQSHFFLAAVSHTFHARDIYGSVCGHLAAGVTAEELGDKIDIASIKRLPSQRYTRHDHTIGGEIVYIDRFGNLITNIPGAIADKITKCTVGSTECKNVGRTYSGANDGEPVMLIGSHGFVEIGVFKGRAVEHFSSTRGTKVILELKS